MPGVMLPASSSQSSGETDEKKESSSKVLPTVGEETEKRAFGNPLQFSCLGNLMDRGAWRATVHGIARSGTGLSD